jgi:O-antigen ligase
MKPRKNSGRPQATARNESEAEAAKALPPDFQIRTNDWFALAFGLLLGLALVKFGNPIILDAKIPPPSSPHDFWTDAWPPTWSIWFLAPLAVVAVWIAIQDRSRRSVPLLLWVLPSVWFGWQLISAARTEDHGLTAMTLLHFAGCVVCYFIGILVIRSRQGLRWLLVGLLAGFVLCLIRAVAQHYEFPRELENLREGERAGWTNFAANVVLQMKTDGVIIHTNGADIANPIFLAKYAKGRVMGTLVYPNALAGAVLLLWPVSLMLALKSTRRFRAATRFGVIALALFMGAAALFWSGSKFGWLIAIALAGVWLLRFSPPTRWKWILLAAVAVVGLTVFTIRFHGYFESGAKSAGARFDYWRAAMQVVAERPLSGSGPGTFQRPYSRLKTPEAEMARLAHNDYLEQFSDSGIIGGIAYTAWIALALTIAGRRLWRSDGKMTFAIFLGLLGWFVQGFGEFSLYIPALAWTAFALLGWLVVESANQIDKPATAR